MAKLVENNQGLLYQYLSLGIPCVVFALPFLFFPSASANAPLSSASAVRPPTEDYSNLLSSSNGVPQSEEKADVPALSSRSEKRLTIEVTIMTAAFLFVYVGAEVGYGGWLAAYGNAVLGMDEAAGAYLTAAYWGTFTLGRLIAVPAALLLTQRQMIILDMVGSALGIGILLVFPTSSTALWIGTMVLGISIASIFPTGISLPQNLGIQLSGSNTGWIVVGASAGEMTVPLAIGALQQLYTTCMPWVVLCVLFIALLLYFLILYRVKWVRERKGAHKGFEFKIPAPDDDEQEDAGTQFAIGGEEDEDEPEKG